MVNICETDFNKVLFRLRFFAKTKQVKYIVFVEFLLFEEIMRNSISERFDILKQFGGLPEPEVINEEWLYILKEETRNSILIEGFFVSDKELEEVLARTGIEEKKWEIQVSLCMLENDGKSSGGRVLTQNPAGLPPCVGSIPTSGTIFVALIL